MPDTSKIVAFGELLLRLTPSDKGRLINTRKLDTDYAGAETNVLSALAFWGHSTRFISRLPQGPLGDSAVLSLKQYGVDTSCIQRGPGRMGTYFIELGASIRPSRVVYDRENSSISQISTEEFDWSSLLKDMDWFHLSGITLALSEGCLNESVKAVECAQDLGVRVSFDMNYRRSLWRDREYARKAFESVMKNTDLLFGNEGSMKDVLDWESKAQTEQKKDLDLMNRVSSEFDITTVAFTRRNQISASLNRLSASLLINSDSFQSPSYQVQVTDRFGTGDAFAAAVLHGICNSWQSQKTMDFAAAAFALKHTIPGDQILAREEEILSIMDGNIHGHVIR